jgi:hypothetical protein
MNPVLIDFEAQTGLGPTYVAKLIGTAYPTYAKYRAGDRPLPLYHERHIEALLLMSQRSLQQLIDRYAYD